MADNSKSADAAAPPRDDVTPHPISPITLTAPGEREVVDAARAGEIVSHWRSQLDAHRERLAAAGLDDTNDSGTTGTNSTREDVVLCDRIVLTDKSYTAEAAAVIATFLTSDQPPPHARPLALAVTHADLSDVIASRMEGEGLTVLKTLCDAFGGGRLRSVDLSDNAMGCKGVTACASVLGGQASTLRELRLCNNGLSEETMGEVASILTAPVGRGEAGAAGGGETADENGGNEHAPCVASNLTKIHFYNNMSGDRGGEEFARILSRCTSSNLTDVRFSGTRARRPGSLMVANALHSLAAGGGGGGGGGGSGRPNDDDGASNANHLSNLTRLDLADNTFGYEGGDVLAKALHGCPNLTYLNLRDCVLEDDATKFICHALWSSGAPIEHLDLSGNEIGPRGARALGDLVEEVGASTLRVLHLEENEMTSRGVRCIARSLTSAAEDGEGGEGDGGGGCGCVLEDLQLGSNECGRIGAAALVAAAPALLPNLRSLGFDGNMIPEEMVAELEAAFGGGEKVLGSMEDNDPDEDVDEEMESEDEEGEGEDDAGAAEDTGEKGAGGGDDGGGAADVDALTAAVGGITIDGFC